MQSAKTKISLRTHAVWSEYSLIARTFYSILDIKRGMNETLPYWVDVQADLSLCWSHWFNCRCCCALAQYYKDSQERPQSLSVAPRKGLITIIETSSHRVQNEQTQIDKRKRNYNIRTALERSTSKLLGGLLLGTVVQSIISLTSSLKKTRLLL